MLSTFLDSRYKDSFFKDEFGLIKVISWLKSEIDDVIEIENVPDAEIDDMLLSTPTSQKSSDTTVTVYDIVAQTTDNRKRKGIKY